MSTIITGRQNLTKNSAAYSEELGIMLIANGEEKPYILTPNGTIFPAGLPAPDAPTIANGSAGLLTAGMWVKYVVVSASDNLFPTINTRVSSNPSDPSTTFHIPTGTGNRKVNVTVNRVDSANVYRLRIYRTPLQASEALADIAGDAGQYYYVGDVANPGAGTVIFEDNLIANEGNEFVDFTNHSVPTFKFVVYDGSFFWGFGNHPLRINAMWLEDGTFVSDTKFYGGRDGQYITFDGVTTGGFDGQGTFIFEQTGEFTGRIQDAEGEDLSFLADGEGVAIIQGESATLYRSKYRNPFGWGYSRSIVGEFVPELWQLKVSGSLGTAIGLIPDQSLLKLDMEFPALCVTFNLQTAATDNFGNTRRQLSRLYSVTSHFSQFAAVSGGRQVLWGMDYKNLAIVESDGVSQQPVSGPISTILRLLSAKRANHLLAHGAYDAQLEINCLWLSSQACDESDSEFALDLCVYQHVPTGFWGIINDYGILSSAVVEDVATSRRRILVGTEFGFLGRAFEPGVYGNWIPPQGLLSGVVASSTITSITRNPTDGDFALGSSSIQYNYLVLVSPDGLTTHVVNILGFTAASLYYDKLLNPPVEAGWRFFIGLIEVSLLKYFNRGTPATDKAIKEFWATITEAQNPTVLYYPHTADEPIKEVALKEDGETGGWFNKLDFPNKKVKAYGLRLIERSYNPTTVYDITIKE